MASYNESPIMSQHSPSHAVNVMSQYPPPPDTSSPTNAPFPPQLYPNTDPALQPAGALPITPVERKTSKAQNQSDSTESKEYRNRLRKACDSCSIRKVKCDETQPCKACRALEIPCTFDRPSKRRGPPNRHADAIKKQRMEASGDPGIPHHSQPSSPTHAAQTLASFAQQQVLSAESIVPWTVLQYLINDYFVFIHPLIPVPHEPSFRAALERREDLSNPTFLALLASMIGALVASFPRRPRQHLRSLHMEHLFPNSLSVVDRCHKVAMEAQGPATYNRTYTVHDAIISYLQGLATGYTFNRDAALLYFRQGLAICTTLGLHKASSIRAAEMPRMTPNGQGLEGPQTRGGDLLIQELGRRTFWLLFTAVESIHQLGCSPFELNIPPATKGDPYPPLPIEVDDAYLTPTQILPQPDGYISELVGFNINIRIYLSYTKISTNELLYGVDQLFDWDRQKQELEQSLANVKRIIEDLPSELRIASETINDKMSGNRYPSPGHLSSPHHFHSNGALSGNPNRDRTHVQLEIQKANIYASQLGTRSYLVEKYFTLSSRRKAGNIVNDNHFTSTKMPNAISPTLSHSSMSSIKPASDSQMNSERYNIIKDFLHVLSSINQVNMEPNGTSFIHKVRSIATTLLGVVQQQQLQGSASAADALTSSTKHDGIPTGIGEEDGGGSLDRARAQEYLRAFLNVLERLENAVPPNQTPSSEDEEAQLKQWADLRGEQERFARSGGWISL